MSRGARARGVPASAKKASKDALGAPPMQWAPVQAPTSQPPWGAQPWQTTAPPPPVPVAQVRGLVAPMLILLAAYLVLDAINLSGLLFVADWGVPDGGAGGAAAVNQVLGFVSSGVSIALAVVFCLWLYRVLEAARRRHPFADISPGWAVGSFFIPFVHLVAPYFAVLRGWKADMRESQAPLAGWFVPWALSLATAYFAAPFIVAAVFRSVLSGIDENGEPDVAAVYEEFRPILLATASIGFVLHLLSAAFLVVVVRRWTAHQERAAQEPASPVS